MTALPATLITGAANRIGRAMASDLAKSGTPICIHANSSGARAEALAAELRNEGGNAVVATADLTSEAGMTSLLSSAKDALGTPIACLVNNASIFEKDEAGSLEPELFARHFAIHATAPAILSDQMVNLLPEDQAGLIINVIDQRVWRLTPNFISYTASKSALWTLTQTLAQAFAEITQGRVRVNAIGPGPTLSNDRQQPEDFQKQIAGLPLGRGPNLDAFAQTITYLWNMPSVTGQMIALDGGQHLAWKTPDIDGIPE